MNCTRCHKRPATDGRKRCDPCRAQQNRVARAYYRRHHVRYPAPTRERAIRMLSMLILSPVELAEAIHITPEHAAVTLLRLYQQGRCSRFISGTLHNGKPMLRYRLRDD